MDIQRIKQLRGHNDIIKSKDSSYFIVRNELVQHNDSGIKIYKLLKIQSNEPETKLSCKLNTNSEYGNFVGLDQDRDGIALIASENNSFCIEGNESTYKTNMDIKIKYPSIIMKGNIGYLLGGQNNQHIYMFNVDLEGLKVEFNKLKYELKNELLGNCLINNRDTIYSFGGLDNKNNFLKEILTFNNTTVTPLKDVEMPNLAYHTCLAIKDKVLFYGGITLINDKIKFNNNIYSFNTTSKEINTEEKTNKSDFFLIGNGGLIKVDERYITLGGLEYVNSSLINNTNLYYYSLVDHKLARITAYEIEYTNNEIKFNKNQKDHNKPSDDNTKIIIPSVVSGVIVMIIFVYFIYKWNQKRLSYFIYDTNNKDLSKDMYIRQDKQTAKPNYFRLSSIRKDKSQESTLSF